MFLKDEVFEEWCNYINDNVKDQTKGALVAAEKIDKGIFAEHQGTYDEVVDCLATLIFMLGYNTAHPFDRVIEDINKAWLELKNNDNYKVTQNDIREGKDGITIIDPKSNFAYNTADDTVSFPPIPQDVKEQMLAFCKEHIGSFDDILRQLETEDGVTDIIAESSNNGTLEIGDDEKGDLTVFFTYKDKKFMYCFADKGYIVNYGRENEGDESNFSVTETFDDTLFRRIILHVIKTA